MEWALNLICGHFINFRNGIKISTLLTFGCPRDEVYFTTLLWQNNGQQNCLISRIRFSELFKIMVKKVAFVGFRGGDRPNRRTRWIRTCCRNQGRTLNNIVMRAAPWMAYFDLSKLNLAKAKANVLKAGNRRDKVALTTTCNKNVKFKIMKIRTCCHVGYFYHSENLNWAAQNLRLGRGLDITGLTHPVLLNSKKSKCWRLFSGKIKHQT